LTFIFICNKFVAAIYNITLMTDREHNKFDRIIRIQAFFRKHLSVISVNVPALSVYVSQLDTALETMFSHRMIATAKLKGYTI
jgi:hypothetical protein